MEIRELISGDSRTGSGGVAQHIFDNGAKITRITTFCPDFIGPGPTHLYLIDHSGVLVLVDTGIPTDLAKSFSTSGEISLCPISSDLCLRIIATESS